MTADRSPEPLPRYSPGVVRLPWYRRLLRPSCGAGRGWSGLWCRWPMILAMVLLLASPWLLGGCSSDTGTETGSGGATIGFSADDGTITVIPAAQRVAAPAITGPTLSGESLTLSDYAGQLVVLNVWASWCGPCRSEAPILSAAAQEHRDVQFLGLVTRDSEASAAAFAKRNGLDYPHLVDTDGSLQLQFRDLPPKAIPSTVVLDEQGRIAARVLGEVHEGTLTGILEQVKG